MTGEDTVVYAEDSEYDCNRTKGGYLKPMHGNGVGCEGVHDAKDEEELEENAEPGDADICISNCRRGERRTSGRERTLHWAVAMACDMKAMNQASCGAGQGVLGDGGGTYDGEDGGEEEEIVGEDGGEVEAVVCAGRHDRWSTCASNFF